MLLDMAHTTNIITLIWQSDQSKTALSFVFALPVNFFLLFAKANMTVMLGKNRHVLNQITTLSTLMMNLSSCVKFDRYRGYDSAEELDTVAQDLAKNRNLYASE